MHVVTLAKFDTEAHANIWAVAELERLRRDSAKYLDGTQCYAAEVEGPQGQHRTAYLFCAWEPIEWDWPSVSWDWPPVS
jgi:hypothetical protein